MAKKPGKDRSLDEIKQRIERTRYELGRDVSGLRYELDFPLKIRKSFQRQTVLWISAALVLGLLFAVGPARKKKIYVDAKGKKKTKDGILEAGLLFSVAKLAASMLKPVIVSYATQKFKARAGGAQSKHKW